VYVIARLGVTGATPQLAADLADTIARVRAATTLPIAAGFGISTPAQAVAVGKLADGVVVGSALVEVLGREGVGAAGAYLAQLRAALDSARPEGAKT
jgi:tryptophan synthase alpha chain